MFPNEIYENIIKYVTNLETIQNCRLVCFDWKEIINNSITKITNEKRDKRIMNRKFIEIFTKLKYSEFYIKIENISINLNTIFLKEIDILDNISWLEDMVLNNKTIKIYKKNCIYWLKLGFYGKYEKYVGEFNEVDGQLMDVCRCETLISNKKPYHYFPVKNFIYLSGYNELTCFDYIPFVNIKSYSWQPVEANDRRKIDFQKEVEKMSQILILISNIYPDINKYEIPILEKDFESIRKKFPNSQNFSILSEMNLHFKNKVINLNNLPTSEQYIDSFLI